MVDFKKLKEMRGQKFIDSLSQELNKISGNSEKKSDERFWRPTVDKAGNGYAVIRFLPPPKGEEAPAVSIWSHAFQGPTGLWYIENSRTTLGKNTPDPVSEFNSKLWNSSSDDDSSERKQARKQKRQLHYYSNIYVVEDPGNPENEGKVFIFKYGKKIFNKINEAIHPQFKDEKPINAFDFWTGANFKLKIRKVEGYPNYDKSEFGPVSALFDDDETLEAIWNKEYSLKELIDPSNFKSYDTLKEHLNKVLDIRGTAEKIVRKAEDDELPWAKEEEAPKLKRTEPPKQASYNNDDDDDDESLEFFKRLAS